MILKLRAVLAITISALLFCFPSYAVATPSDAEEVNTFDENAPLSWVPDAYEELTSNGVAASPVNVYRAQEVEVLSDEQVADKQNKNTVVFSGVFNGRNCQLVIPYADYASLDVIGGKLVNVSKSTVQGRLLYEGSLIDPSEYDTYTYNLGSVYGSTSSVYQNGSFNYERHYYLSRSGSYDRIVYDDTYGDFQVTSTSVGYSASERVYYLGFVIVFMLGGIILCFRRMR